MNAPLPACRAQPFFLQADPGQRFCVYFTPDPHVPPRGAIVYIHPFAEELNKSRRMAALQARSFAARGYAVLMVDLHGCGDSDGDFGDARWDTWLDDIAAARAWLASRIDGPMCLWGLRLGALLALEHASAAQVDSLILWHPIASGKSCIRQLLRVLLSAQMIDGHGGTGGVNAREQLERDGMVEVAGYTLTRELVRGIEMRDLGQVAPKACAIDWFGSHAQASTALRTAQTWQGGAVRLDFHEIAGIAFWTTSEVTECAALLAATDALAGTTAP
jgi:exosortase A-associated hydrolase 2